MKSIFAVCAVMMTLLLTGCAKPVSQDYSAFKQSKPKSILVLLPQNQSPEVEASHGMLSQVTYPLSEAGYYVLPVAVVEETFKQNGMTNATDISAVSPAKVVFNNINTFSLSWPITVFLFSRRGMRLNRGFKNNGLKINGLKNASNYIGTCQRL